ncbi:MAG: BamA/TamA family outer membrane protein [Filimonas sp.]|nr:BamA/TamA family outer membrane protein [Filimonas sp.]
MYKTILFRNALVIVLLFVAIVCHAQRDTFDLSRQKDLLDIAHSIFKAHDTASVKNKSTIALLPALGYNPSIGFQIGINMTGGKYLGNKDNTTMSVGALGGYVTTKGIVCLQFRHNAFTEKNKWNFQGNWQVSRIVTLDYGVGTGITEGNVDDFSIIGIPVRNADSVYPIKFTYIRFTERAYREIASHLYAGFGVSVDIRTKIDDEKRDSGYLTPHYLYNNYHGFDPQHYTASGFLFDLLYNTKEHPNRAYGGTYADVGVRVNQTWVGSTKNSFQAFTELRKYWSLSKRMPEHVIAFWHWGSYRLSGDIPYLELPGTGSDTYARSGRGYTTGRFKGKSFFYAETEYRFPLSDNHLFGGVVFCNVQSGSNDTGVKLMQNWEPGYGLGLRVLFNKNTRTNICFDYARGRYGASGFFLGLNEVF